MSKSISILGSGWLGIPLADSLMEQGHEVVLSTSNQEKLEDLQSQGYKSVQIDIVKQNKLPTEFQNSEVLIIAITSKDVEAFRSLIEQINTTSVKQVIFISSTSVYDFCNCEITEDTPTNNSPIAQIERVFQELIPERTTILRFSGLFGYNRKPANFFRYKAIPNANAFVNMIHRDDCIAIIQKLIEKEIVGKEYNAAADTHPTKEEFYTKTSLDVGYPAPKVQESSKLMYKIILNNALKSDLEYEFKYGDLMKVDFSSC